MSQELFKTPQPLNEEVLSYKPQAQETVDLRAALKTYGTQVQDCPAIIDGKWETMGESQTVPCPHQRTLELARVHQSTPAQVEAAIKAASEARKSWALLAWEDRAAVFLKAAYLLKTKYRAQMNALTMLAQSKTPHQAEIDASCELIDFWNYNVRFAETIYQNQPVSAPGIWNRVDYRPLEGFVYAISPFNFTSIALNLATAPALMGCTVIWKPTHQAMPSNILGMKILEEAGLPPGVINMLPGDPVKISEQLLQSRDLAGIHFTGSTAVFNQLWLKVGQNISQYRSYPRLVGETGGKDFVFAHPSADLNALLHHLIRGAFEYQGQKCSAASRFYVPRGLWQKLRPKLIELTQAIKMGDPSDFSNFMGAVIDQRAFTRIKQAIAGAKASSEAKIIAGGECEDELGFFIRPTIIETTDPRSHTMVNELFGPVLTVYVYEEKDLEATLDLIDQSTPYALTGAIFAQDRGVLAYLSQRLREAAGNFYLNDKPTGAVVGQQPFGGGRASGTNDKAGSTLNLLRWTSPRAIKENFIPLETYRYPYMGEP